MGTGVMSLSELDNVTAGRVGDSAAQAGSHATEQTAIVITVYRIGIR